MGIRGPKCFTATHTPSAIIGTIDVNNPFVTVFEDTTMNHNKILFTVRNLSITETFTVTIHTDSDDPDPIIVPPNPDEPAALDSNETSVQVENARLITISSTHNTDDQPNFQFSVTKTFCICCQGRQCSIDTHTFNNTIGVPAGSSRTVFQDLTTNHNKTIVRLSITQVEGAVLSNAGITATFRTDLVTENRTIFNFQPLIIQWEDLREITLTPLADPGGSFNVAVEYQKTFCICCP
ncbi:hypothetical protein J2Z37_004467 [Ammoniphilus resinae]|uniref:Uncharacterized protein n=2 Tax=Ammoniphilus resinae TaxID=861532 RepID=A0ABS4GWP1_9BACL|nr:hypothetical protein [Ammoniphilus resinae]